MRDGCERRSFRACHRVTGSLHQRRTGRVTRLRPLQLRSQRGLILRVHAHLPDAIHDTDSGIVMPDVRAREKIVTPVVDSPP